jgi:hypothetical protein
VRWRLDENKPKHLFLEVEEGVEMHFNCGSRDAAEDIMHKLKKSRKAAGVVDDDGAAPPAAAPPGGTSSPARKGVHFSEAPVIIHAEEQEDEGVEEADEDTDEPAPEQTNGHSSSPAAAAGGTADLLEPAAALYDFTAQGDDELSVTEGAPLWIVERDGDEWWKVRDGEGNEGVVPASYIEVRAAAVSLATLSDGHSST